jgi:hypothetical protein
VIRHAGGDHAPGSISARGGCDWARLRLHPASILFALFVSGTGWADACGQLPAPALTVKRYDEPITMNFEHGYKALNVLAVSLARPGRRVLGLTRGKAVVKFESRTATVVDRSGQWECASPQISVTYGFSPMTVYVAKEFPPGSCAYQAILAHELQHVKIYQDHLLNIEKGLTDTLSRRFVTGGPWRGPVGQTSARLQREVEERWLPYVKREIDRVDAAQAVIDTPEEYARVVASCGGEIRQRIR